MNRQFSIGGGKSKSPALANKQWVHPAETLIQGHIVYTVKFLGHIEVDQAKGIETVKGAIRKIKFSKHLKRAEGQKPPKVDLSISVDGVTIQDTKTKIIQHRCPLHKISYCADDKSDKRMFTFIARDGDTNRHNCFVFDSEKCAEEITLTVGQAFELAYRRFIDSSTKDLDAKKQFLMLHKKVQELTVENGQLREKVECLERLFDSQTHQGSRRVSGSVSPSASAFVGNGDQCRSNGSLFAAHNAEHKVSPPNVLPFLSPPPAQRKSSGNAQTTNPFRNSSEVQQDLFGSPVFSPTTIGPPVTSPSSATRLNPFDNDLSSDPFGMGKFNPTQDIDQQIQNVDQELLDLKTGFSRGISFGTDDFTLDDLDPLNNNK